METWSPFTREELEALIAKQLPSLTVEQRELYDRIKVPLRSVSILRFGSLESVYVLAQRGNTAIYYEDVEDGFNISDLAPDGSIATPGFEQWELRHVLHNFDA